MAWKTSVAIFAVAAIGLAGCDENGEFNFQMPDFGRSAQDAEPSPEAAQGAGFVERDVPAPDVFQTTEAGLWDGRPSFGGVWVAHPDVEQEERVVVRNTANGREVISALFKRTRDFPGPRIQVSDEAATALGMLAGQPVQLDVTALRRERVAVAAPADDNATAADAQPQAVTEEPLDAIAAAAAAIDEAEESATAANTASAAQPTAPAATPAAAPASSLDKPFVQIGIFSVEANANNTAASLRNIGIVPTILRQESVGKVFWRVIVGPATTAQDRAAVLAQVKDLGFSDAYFVTN